MNYKLWSIKEFKYCNILLKNGNKIECKTSDKISYTSDFLSIIDKTGFTLTIPVMNIQDLRSKLK